MKIGDIYEKGVYKWIMFDTTQTANPKQYRFIGMGSYSEDGSEFNTKISLFEPVDKEEKRVVGIIAVLNTDNFMKIEKQKP